MTGAVEKRTITISRQMGSHGKQVAQSLAELLSYPLVWREVINQAARRAGAPEAALAAIDELGLFGICPAPEVCQAYIECVEQVLLELAEKGNVIILGRAGQVVLQNRPDVLHVRLTAPYEVRIARVSAEQQISLAAARAQVETSDRFRRNYLKKFYNVNWEDSTLYDLVINTARITVQGAAGLIADALQDQPIAQSIQGG